MQAAFSSYVLDDQLSRFDFATCHRWLTDAYWSKGIPRESVEHAFSNSTLVVGAYEGDVQIGCLRAVSDRTRFGYLFDVYVDSKHRGQGLGRKLVSFALEHPDLSRVFIWMLGTLDAHGVYAPLGFAPIENPERLLRRVTPAPWATG